MSSPMIETVREIPLIIEREYPMECEDTGFPFDNDRSTDSPFRSQLDDLAARHPELAQQFNFGSLPFRSRRTTPDPFSHHQRFGTPDRSFGFERFGFPFDNEPTQEPNEQKRYYQRYPQYYPQNNDDNNDAETSNTQPHPHPRTQNIEAEPNENGEQPTEPRGRKKQNVQQSNTVDLGQPQEQFVDARNQRSMSAPPPNSRPARYVSSINIPINQNQPKEHQHQQQPQAAAPSHPQERVIPIHVEGRDEPIVPKQIPRNQQQQTHHQPNFNQRTSNFPEYFQRDQPFQNEWFPRGFKQQQQQAPPSQQGFSRGRSPQPQAQPQPKQTVPPKQPEQTVPRPAEAGQAPHQQQQQEKPKAQPPENVDPPSKPHHDPIDQIKMIQKDVSELMGQVDQFDGKPRDKQYLYLDEMLTRNLIKLDNIDTQGQENIRLARKEAIKCIEKCISILESKALANVEEKQNMEVETAEGGDSNPEKSDEKEGKENETMEVEGEATATVEKTEEIMEAENVSKEDTQMESQESLPDATVQPETKKEETVVTPSASDGGGVDEKVETKVEEAKEDKNEKKKTKKK